MSDINPYQPPESPITLAAAKSGTFIPNGREVDSTRGWDWITNGFALFWKQPGMWILLVIIFAVIYIVISIVPVLGSIANALLLPVFGAGFMRACDAQARGASIKFDHLFEGFKRNTGDLVLVGLMSLVAGVVILLPVIVLIGGAGFMAAMHGGHFNLAAAGLTAMVAALIAMALSIPVCMALWFAPALVVFHNFKSIEALKHSFFGCSKNIVPFLIYSVVALLLAVIAVIPFGLGFLIWVPVVVASVYSAYRDIFVA